MAPSTASPRPGVSSKGKGYSQVHLPAKSTCRKPAFTATSVDSAMATSENSSYATSNSSDSSDFQPSQGIEHSDFSTHQAPVATSKNVVGSKLHSKAQPKQVAKKLLVHREPGALQDTQVLHFTVDQPALNQVSCS